MGRPQRVGIFTGGGTAPGLNAVIHGATCVLRERGNEIIGIRDGWYGLLAVKDVIDLTRFTHKQLAELIVQGGTILGSSRTKIDATAYEQVRSVTGQYGLNGVIAVGGDDTLTQANRLSESGNLNIIGVPKTIDNDLYGTDRTFGFESAYHQFAQYVRIIRRGAEGMHRVAAVQAMGRDAGWIALNGGHAGGADIILLWEFPIPQETLYARIRELYHEQGFVVIAIAESYQHNGNASEDGRRVDAFGHAKKEGAAKSLLRDIEEKMNLPTLEQVTAYLVRDGDPIATDVTFASELGATAGLLAHEKKYGRMVSLRNGAITHVSLSHAKGGRQVDRTHYNPETLRKHDLPPNIVNEMMTSRHSMGRTFAG